MAPPPAPTVRQALSGSHCDEQKEILDQIAYRGTKQDPAARPGIESLPLLTADGFFTSEIGIDYLGYIGNTYLTEFRLPPCPRSVEQTVPTAAPRSLSSALGIGTVPDSTQFPTAWSSRAQATLPAPAPLRPLKDPHLSSLLLRATPNVGPNNPCHPERAMDP